MLCLLASNNEGLRLLTSNNESVQKMVVKYLPSYYGTTKAPNNSDPLIFGPSTVGVRRRKSKRTTRNKDSSTMTANNVTKKQNNSDPLIPVALTESIRSYKSEYINTKNDVNKRDGTLSHIRTIGY